MSQNDDPRINPRTASILEQDGDIPYGRRSFTSVVSLILVMAFICAIIYWLFIMESLTPTLPESSSVDTTLSVAAPNTQAAPTPLQTEAQEDEGVIHEFVEDIFSGAADGLDSDHGDTDLGFGNTKDGMIAYSEMAAEIKNYDDTYKHSLRDVIGSDVNDRSGVKAGEVYDVLINKETGEARAIIVDKSESYYERDLSLLRFKKINTQATDGDVRSTITEDQMDDKQEFLYGALDNTKYISLKNLRDGQILDFEGNMVGQVQAVIYENAEANRIYFSLKDSMVPTGKAKNFSLPYKGVNVIENKDGLDIKLTKEQTVALADILYADPEPTQQVPAQQPQQKAP